MVILPENKPEVKQNNVGSGALSPDADDKALLGSNLRAASGPFGESSPIPSHIPGPRPGPSQKSNSRREKKPINPLATELVREVSYSPTIQEYSPASPISLDVCEQLGISGTEAEAQSGTLASDTTKNYYQKLYCQCPPEPAATFVPQSHTWEPDPDWPELLEKHVAGQERIAAVLVRCGRRYEAAKIRNCERVFRMHRARCCGDTYAFAYHCDQRLCPVCMARRSAKLKERILRDILPKMKQPKHIVLTVKNPKHIDKEFFRWLRRCFTKLRHRKLWREANVDGGVYNTETTRNYEMESWHPHLHILADVRWIDKKQLWEAWHDITGDSFNVHIKAVGYDKDQTPEDAAEEIAKYIVKPGRFLDDPDLVDEYLNAVKGMRLFQPFGRFCGMKGEDEVQRPSCWCGKNEWEYVGDFPLKEVYKDEYGHFRRDPSWRPPPPAAARSP